MTLLPCSVCCPCPTVTKRDGNPYPTSIDVDITCTGWGGDAWLFYEYFGCYGVPPRTWAFGLLRSAPSSGVYSLELVNFRLWGYFSRFISITVEILSESQLDQIVSQSPVSTCVELARIWVGVNGRQDGVRGRTDQFINCNDPPRPAAFTKSELEAAPSAWDTQLSIVTYCRHRSPVTGQSGCGPVPSHTTYASYGNRPGDSINGQTSATPLQSPAIPATWQTMRLGLGSVPPANPPLALSGPYGQVNDSAATLVINSVVAHYSDGVDRNVFDI